ncbi:YggT family protein [Serinibacter salmoneus]|uniref:YggT family protein n=1 Tax=Serinibacter salmoneus TaxID=556530 RepID=A0A2A9CYC1_9MICO|nr:YggT family protein [Serinibacter salmoneus]
MIGVVALVGYVIVLLFVVAMLVRIVFDVVQMVARQWRPSGIALVAAEAVYTTTDPPLRLVRRFIPPLRLGGIALDLAFIIIMILAWILMGILGGLSI